MSEQPRVQPVSQHPDQRVARLRSVGDISELDTYRLVIQEMNELNLEQELDDILWLPLAGRTCQRAAEIYTSSEKFDTSLRQIITDGQNELLSCLIQERTAHPAENFHELLAGGLIVYSAFSEATKPISGVTLPKIDQAMREAFDLYRQNLLASDPNCLKNFHSAQPTLSAEIYRISERSSARGRLTLYSGAYLTSQLLKFAIHQERNQGLGRTPNRVITS